LYLLKKKIQNKTLVVKHFFVDKQTFEGYFIAMKETCVDCIYYNDKREFGNTDDGGGWSSEGFCTRDPEWVRIAEAYSHWCASHEVEP